MSIIKWSQDLSVNIKEIDDQHKKLIDLINTLHDNMLKGQGKVVLESTLQELAAYTQYHFSAEEKYMKRFGYVDYDAHKLEHEEFIRKVSEFINSYRSNQACLSIEVMNFLKDWITNHIKGSDKGYMVCFSSNGLT